MRVLVVTGSRFGTGRLGDLREAVARADLVLHGGASGVDQQAEDIAIGLGIHTLVIKAQWAHYGKAAGPRRNSVLAAAAVVFKGAGHDVTYVAFPGPHSSGTLDAMEKLVAQGIEGKVLP